MLVGDGGGISVDTAQLEAAAGSLRSLSQDVDNAASDLVAALGGAENGVGDPSATSAVSDLIQSWIGPLSLLAPLLEKLSEAVSGSAGVYSTTDAAVARHAQ